MKKIDFWGSPKNCFWPTAIDIYKINKSKNKEIIITKKWNSVL